MDCTNFKSLAVEFVLCTEIAEREYNRDNKIHAAYWIGQATVFEQIIEYGLDMEKDLKAYNPDTFHKWVMLRAKSNMMPVR